MARPSQFAAIVLALMALAMWMDRQTSAILPPVPAMARPVSRAQALAMGLSVGRGWGEPYPVVIGAAQSSTSDWLAQLKAHGEYINMGDQGALWLVRLSGHFTVDRAPAGTAPPQCQKMFVVIVVASGDIISVGCE
jgi:hypothetical protein